MPIARWEHLSFPAKFKGLDCVVVAGGVNGIFMNEEANQFTKAARTSAVFIVKNEV